MCIQDFFSWNVPEYHIIPPGTVWRNHFSDIVHIYSEGHTSAHLPAGHILIAQKAHVFQVLSYTMLFTPCHYHFVQYSSASMSYIHHFIVKYFIG